MNKPKMLGAPSISRLFEEKMRNGWDTTNPANLLTRDFRAAEANSLILFTSSLFHAFIHVEGFFQKIVL